MIQYLFFFVALCSVLSAEPKRLTANVKAQTAILIDAKTGAILYEKEPHRRMFPSSITKIASTYYFLEKMGGHRLDEEVLAPRDCLTVVPANVRSDPSCPSYRLDPRGTRMWLMAGEQVSFRTLVYGAMLPSGNDASNVLAYHCSGSIEQFMEELNQFIQQFGIKDTHFTNPHGLHDDAHYTTAYDMARIAQAAMRNPLFREVVQTEHYVRPKTNMQPAAMLDQHNLLMRKGMYYYPKATGIKTGGAFLSKNTLVASAEDGNRSLIAVLLGCAERRQNFRDAVTLFEAAFNEEKVSRTFFAKGGDTFSLEVKGGREAVRGGLFHDVVLQYYPSEEPEVKALLKWADVQMPIREGDVVGEIQLVNGEEQVIKRAPLFALKDVEPTLSFLAKTWLYHHRVLLFSAVMVLALGLTVFRIHEKRGSQKVRRTEAK